MAGCIRVYTRLIISRIPRLYSCRPPSGGPPAAGRHVTNRTNRPEFACPGLCCVPRTGNIQRGHAWLSATLERCCTNVVYAYTKPDIRVYYTVYDPYTHPYTCDIRVPGSVNYVPFIVVTQLTPLCAVCRVQHLNANALLPYHAIETPRADSTRGFRSNTAHPRGTVPFSTAPRKIDCKL